MYVVLRIPGPERIPSIGRILPFFLVVNGKKPPKKTIATAITYTTKLRRFKEGNMKVFWENIAVI